MPEHAFDAQMQVNGVWLNVTSDVRQTSVVTVSKGGGEVSQAPKPSTLALTFNDPVGKYRPDRAMSPFYGQVGRNTPIAVPGGIFEISGWSPDRTVDHDPALGRGDQTTDIDAGGLLRRVGTWTNNVQSALSQAIVKDLTSTTNPILGYWRLEDEAGARYPKPEVGTPADPRMSFYAQFGTPEGPFGANSVVKTADYCAVAARYLPGSTSAGWKMGFAFKLANLITSTGYDRIMLIQTRQGIRFDVFINNANFRIQFLDLAPGGGVTTVDIPYTGTQGPLVWTWMTVEVSVATATTCNWILNWYAQSDTVTWSQSGTAPVPAGSLDFWQIAGNDGTASNNGMFGHVVGVQGTAPNLYSFNIVSAFNGWAGELAGDRFARLMDLSGLSWTIRGSAATTAPMGPQGPNTLLEHLREIRDTEDGMLYDNPTALAITLRTRNSLYNQVPMLALTWGVNVAPPLRPVIDDLNTANVIEVSNRLGGSYTARDDTSPMGTLPPPAGVNEQKQRIDVNMTYDKDLQPRAEWARAIGTNPEARYSSVVVDLDANPSLETAAEAVQPGDRITVRGADPDLIDLLVIGITCRYDTKFRKTATFTCRPYRIYAVGKADDVARYDSGSTVANVTYAPTTTAIRFRTANPEDLWSLAPDPANPATWYDVMCAGERWSVTSMGAVSGTAPNLLQQATVIRSVNGVVKTIPIESPIRIATPGRWAL